MAGFQQLKVTREVDFTGATQIGIGGEYIRGNVYYVDSTTGDNDYDGRSWDNAVASITQALVLVAAATPVTTNHIIMVAQGDYTEHVTVASTLQGTKIIGLSSSGLTRGGTMMIASEASNLISCKCHNLEVASMAFYNSFAAPAVSSAEDAWGANTWRLHVHDSFFCGAGTGTYGVWAGGVGTEAVHTVVEDCRFYETVTASIRNNGSGNVLRRNIFDVPAAAYGIEHVPNGTSRPYTKILDNIFTAINSSTSVGIQVTNTPTAGYLHINGNSFVNFADDDACCSKRTGYMGLNYAGATAVTVTT